MTKPVDHHNRLELDIVSAMKTMRQLMNRKADIKNERSGGFQVIYAVDSMILSERLFGDQTQGLSFLDIKEDRKPFSRLFKGPKRVDEAVALAAQLDQILLHYLLISIPGKSQIPLIILPGHLEEVRFIHDKLIERFEARNKYQNEIEGELLKYLRELKSVENEDIEKAQIFADKKDQIYELLYAIEQPFDKLRLFHSLFSRQLLTPINAAPNIDALQGLINPSSRKKESVFLDNRLRQEYFPIQSSVDWWNDNLGRFYTHHGNQYECDLNALSTLSRINHILEPSGKRVVLFTLSDTLIKAGMEYKPFKGSKSDERDLTFTDLYLRHAVCLFEDLEFLVPSDETLKSNLNSNNSYEYSSLLSWLQTIIFETTGFKPMNFKRGQSPSQHPENYRPLIKMWADQTSSEQPTLHKKLHEYWRNHMKGLVVAHGTTSDMARQEFARRITNEHHDEIAALNILQEYVDDLTFQSWHDLTASLTDWGLDLLKSHRSGSETLSRNPPLVYFGKDAPMKNLRLVLNQGEKSKETTQRLIGELERVKDKRKFNKKESAYLEFVIYGYLYSHYQRWGPVKLLSQRAIEIAEEYRSQETEISDIANTGGISGREAYYLLTFANRVTAKGTKELNESRIHIENGKKAVDLEHSLGAKDATKLRFKAENIAYDLSHILFELFTNNFEPDLKKSDIRNLNKVVDDLVELENEKGQCKDSVILNYVSMAIFCNYLTCYALLSVKMNSDEHKKCVNIVTQKYLDIISLDDSGTLVPGSLSFIDIVMLRYGILFTDCKEGICRQIIEEFEKIKSADKMKELCIMPYDKKRFRYIFKLINEFGST